MSASKSFNLPGVIVKADKLIDSSVIKLLLLLLLLFLGELVVLVFNKSRGSVDVANEEVGLDDILGFPPLKSNFTNMSENVQVKEQEPQVIEVIKFYFINCYLNLNLYYCIVLYLYYVVIKRNFHLI